LAWAGSQLGLEVEEVSTPYGGVGSMLARGAPAVLQLQTPQGPAYALLLGHRWGQVRLLATNGRVLHCPTAGLRDALLQPLQGHALPEIDRLLDAAQVTPARRARARQALLAERLGTQALHNLWILRSPASARAAGQLARARMAPRMTALLLALLATYGMELLGWRLMGGAALDGRLDPGWLAAWVLMVLSLVPLHALTGWIQTGITFDAGRMLKQRLFAGALALDVDRVRHLGTGQWLSRMMEAQALESHGLAAAMGLLVAAVELLLAMAVLWQGAAPAAHLTLLTVWLAVTAGMAWQLFLRQRHWTQHRLSLTHDLIERMVGHRTRLAQERPARRDADEDRRCAGYLGASKRLDTALMPLAGLLAGGWVWLAFAVLLPAFVHSAPGLTNPMDSGPGHAGLNATSLAISLGGILLAHRAFTGLAAGLAALASARIAWSQVATLYDRE
jgi:ATP-binding cassette subfamily B protein